MTTRVAKEGDCGFCGKWIDDLGCENTSNVQRSDGSFWWICDKCVEIKRKAWFED